MRGVGQSKELCMQWQPAKSQSLWADPSHSVIDSICGAWKRKILQMKKFVAHVTYMPAWHTTDFANQLTGLFKDWLSHGYSLNQWWWFEARVHPGLSLERLMQTSSSSRQSSLWSHHNKKIKKIYFWTREHCLKLQSAWAGCLSQAGSLCVNNISSSSTLTHSIHVVNDFMDDDRGVNNPSGENTCTTISCLIYECHSDTIARVNIV